MDYMARGAEEKEEEVVVRACENSPLASTGGFLSCLETTFLCGGALTADRWLLQLRKSACWAAAALSEIHVYGTTSLTVTCLAVLPAPHRGQDVRARRLS